MSLANPLKTEPDYKWDSTSIPHGDDIDIDFRGEDWGDGPKDTRVSLPRIGTLCWISWEDKEKFKREFKELIDRYAI